MNSLDWEPEAGQVYRAALGRAGHELTGSHYVLIVSDGAYNGLSTVVVVPFSTGAKRYSWRLGVNIRGKLSLALVDQVRVLETGSPGIGTSPVVRSVGRNSVLLSGTSGPARKSSLVKQPTGETRITVPRRRPKPGPPFESDPTGSKRVARKPDPDRSVPPPAGFDTGP